MRVLLIDPWGIANTSEYLNGLISGLSSKTDLTVITNYNFNCKDENDYTARIYRWFFKKSENMNMGILRKIIRGLEYAITYRKIIRHLKKEQPYDVVHINWLLNYSLDVSFLKKIKKLSRKLVYTAHNVIPHINGKKSVEILRQVYSYPDRIILHGEAVQQDFVKLYPEYANKVYIQKHGSNLIPNIYYDINNIDTDIICKIEKYKKIFICFGYIFVDKGIDRVVHLWNNEWKDSLLIIAGKTDEAYSELSDALIQKNLDNLLFLNRFVDDNTLNYLISKSDIIVLPYRKASMSGVVFTACDFSKPILTTNAGAISEYLSDGIDSFVVNNDDLELRKKIEDIVKNISCEQLSIMGTALHTNINNTCSWNVVTTKLIHECYEDINEKTVLLVMTTLRTGGIATSIKNLLHEICNNDELEISILLFDKKSIGENELPANIKVLGSGSVLPQLITLSQTETNNLSRSLGITRLIAGALAKFMGQKVAYKFLFRASDVRGNWDYAISCTQSARNHRLYGGCNEFVLNKVTAKNKIAFLHCDYVRYGINSKYSHEVYSRFDKIAAVSESVKNQFIRSEPSLADKTYVVTNCHKYESIISMAEDNPIGYDKSVFNIITVARLSVEKGHFRFLEVLKRLTDDGYKLHWHILGDSNDNYKNDFVEKCTEYNLTNVTLYGNQNNPYRYMLNADLLLVPSFHEAAPMVFSEAAAIKLPILSTETLSAKEIVEMNGIGYVCENSANGLYEGIVNILTNLDSFVILKKNMPNFNNNEAIRQFYSLLGVKEEK